MMIAVIQIKGSLRLKENLYLFLCKNVRKLFQNIEYSPMALSTSDQISLWFVYVVIDRQIRSS